MLKNKFNLLLLIFILLALPLYAEDPAFPSHHKSNDGSFKIGMLLPLSGSYASGGVDNRQGIEAALATSKTARPLEIIYADSKADAVTGINEFRKLTKFDEVFAVYVMRGSVGMAINPISQSTKTSLLGGVGNKDFTSVNKYAFQIWSRSDDEGAFLAKTFKAKEYNRSAILTVQDDWQSAVSIAFRKEFPDQETKIVFDEEVAPAEADFRAMLLKIKTASPDVIFANLSVAQLGSFLKQAKELSIKANIYCNFWVAKKDVIESAGLDVVEGTRFIEMDTNIPALKKFVSEKYSSLPSGATLSGYAAIMLLQQVINANPDISTNEQLYKELLKQTEIQTPDGSIPIKDRCVKFPLVEKIIHSGKVEVVH